jgi:hypothetical protein
MCHQRVNVIGNPIPALDAQRPIKLRGYAYPRQVRTLIAQITPDQKNIHVIGALVVHGVTTMDVVKGCNLRSFTTLNPGIFKMPGLFF